MGNFTYEIMAPAVRRLPCLHVGWIRLFIGWYILFVDRFLQGS